MSVPLGNSTSEDRSLQHGCNLSENVRLVFCKYDCHGLIKEQHDQLLVATDGFEALLARPNTSPDFKEHFTYTTQRLIFKYSSSLPMEHQPVQEVFNYYERWIEPLYRDVFLATGGLKSVPAFTAPQKWEALHKHFLRTLLMRIQRITAKCDALGPEAAEHLLYHQVRQELDGILWHLADLPIHKESWKRDIVLCMRVQESASNASSTPLSSPAGSGISKAPEES